MLLVYKFPYFVSISDERRLMRTNILPVPHQQCHDIRSKFYLVKGREGFFEKTEMPKDHD